MSEQLVVIEGPDEGQVFKLAEGRTYVIGRGDLADLSLSDPTVSRNHCQLEMKHGTAVLRDASSRSGTRVNSQPIREHVLRPDDVISLAATRLLFQAAAAGRPRPPALTEPAQKMAELVGTMLAHYKIGLVMAEGRSGLVFRAQDTKENRPVALKVFWPEFADDEEALQRFIRATRTMLPLRHPNLVTLLRGGRRGPYCWMAMEYVQGEPLTTMIQRIGSGGKLDWRPALRVALDVCRGLNYLHGQRIIHRNLSPDNILFSPGTGTAKLASLTLAKALAGELATDVTTSGQMLGDPHYLSPEQAGAGGKVDCRSDVYSLGAVVYALLTGRPPFVGRSAGETVAWICERPPTPPRHVDPSVPDILEQIVLTMLAKKQADRYQTAEELLADLEVLPKV